MERNATRDLPAELELPLRTGAPWWYWLGGRPALDFVNTRRERWNRRVETLATPDDLALWLVHAGLADAPPAGLGVARLKQARELREAIDALVSATLAPAPAPGTALRQVDRWLVHATLAPTLGRDADGHPELTLRPPADVARRALGELALDAARMLGTPEERSRIRVCAADDCSARFYDRSPAGRRRWCSMEGCGNAAKARRHRARHVAGSTSQVRITS